jgi:hypothetical protein
VRLSVVNQYRAFEFPSGVSMGMKQSPHSQKMELLKFLPNGIVQDAGFQQAEIKTNHQCP